jgi:hypothetical protein
MPNLATSAKDCFLAFPARPSRYGLGGKPSRPFRRSRSNVAEGSPLASGHSARARTRPESRQRAPLGLGVAREP